MSKASSISRCRRVAYCGSTTHFLGVDRDDGSTFPVLLLKDMAEYDPMDPGGVGGALVVLVAQGEGGTSMAQS